jgi:hypothetical protein
MLKKYLETLGLWGAWAAALKTLKYFSNLKDLIVRKRTNHKY